MKVIPAGDAGSIDLSQLIFTAKIDYLTVHTHGKRDLPSLDGLPRWSRKENYRKLSIHDPSPADVACVADGLDNPRLAELEVAVDMAPSRHLAPETRSDLIARLMVDLVARGLAPATIHKDLAFGFRGAYEGAGDRFRLLPFNRRLPSARAQQLHGKRHDALQVKSYPKKTDQGRDLPFSDHVTRVEVRLSGDGLHQHGLVTVVDLIGFRYRKALMPYFRHVSTARRRDASATGSPLLQILQAKKHEFLLKAWEQVGVGSMLPGGRYGGADVRLVRNTAVNNRIGQALTRLERQMKSVRSRGSH